MVSSTGSTGSPVDGRDQDITNHDVEEVWDPSGNLLGVVDRGRGGGVVDGGGGEGEAARAEEGRRRHDLSLVSEDVVLVAWSISLVRAFSCFFCCGYDVWYTIVVFFFCEPLPVLGGRLIHSTG